MDRHKEQKNRFELQETDKNLLSGNVKCLRLEPQDKKTKVSKLMLDNFAQLQFFFFLCLWFYRYRRV